MDYAAFRKLPELARLGAVYYSCFEHGIDLLDFSSIFGDSDALEQSENIELTRRLLLGEPQGWE